MRHSPKRIKFKRTHKFFSHKGQRGTKLCVYSSGIKVSDSLYLTYAHYEIVRVIISRLFKVKGPKNKKNLKLIRSALKRKRKKPVKQERKIILRPNLNLGMTKKPSQVRMGKGKGTVYLWVSPMNPNRIIFELSLKKFRVRRFRRIFRSFTKLLPSHLRLSIVRFPRFTSFFDVSSFAPLKTNKNLLLPTACLKTAAVFAAPDSDDRQRLFIKKYFYK
jgi:ribosomal protein L16/L10AE